MKYLIKSILIRFEFRKKDRVESGFVWERFVIGVHPFPISTESCQIIKILVDFYTRDWKKVKMKWEAENGYLMITNKQLYDQALDDKQKNFASKSFIAKATNKWYSEFDRGMHANVFLESLERPSIEEVLSEELANDLKIQSKRYRSSSIENPHIRY